MIVVGFVVAVRALAVKWTCVGVWDVLARVG